MINRVITGLGLLGIASALLVPVGHAQSQTASYLGPLVRLPSPSPESTEVSQVPKRNVQVEDTEPICRPSADEDPLFRLGQHRHEWLLPQPPPESVPAKPLGKRALLGPPVDALTEPSLSQTRLGSYPATGLVQPHMALHADAATSSDPIWQPCEPLSCYDPSAFSPDPDYTHLPYDAHRELGIYEGKWWNPTQRPIVELFRGLYRNGPLPPSVPVLAETNLLIPHFLVYGDFRSAVAFNDNGRDDEFGVWANRLNLDFDLKITATERLHAFWGPLDDGGLFTRAEFRNDNIRLFQHLDEDFDTLFFEGDLGAIWGGMTDQWAPFDLPFVVGKFPLLFQNGVWLFDVVEGFAFTIPSRNSPFLDWPNFDLTFFFLSEDIDSRAFANDEDGQAFGFNWFLDAYEGFFEIGYAYIHDQGGLGLSHHNAAFAYTRRYFHRVSNSVRVIVNTSQNAPNRETTADGTVLLIENALITSNPVYFVPYCNLFAGFGRPQQVAGFGLLTNTGITFETDFLTGFPLLDASANNTYGAAAGINLLGPDFTWQLLLELSTVQTHSNDSNRIAAGDQYGFGMRFQMPLTNAWLIRLDSMYGLLEDAPDIRGSRLELRWKF